MSREAQPADLDSVRPERVSPALGRREAHFPAIDKIRFTPLFCFCELNMHQDSILLSINTKWIIERMNVRILLFEK